MIVLNLSCPQQHHFEGWFASNAAFVEQQAGGLVICPLCGETDIARLPASPRIIGGRGSGAETAVAAAGVDADTLPTASRQTAIRELLQRYHAAENVGKRFPTEARRIHYEEAPQRNIRGVATLSDARELLEEGISVLPLPIPARDEQH